MAKGLEVLQAALAGKRVRKAGESGWWHWDPNRYALVTDSRTPWAISGFIALWENDWEIEADAPMTFFEADKAMLAGKVVQRSAEGMGDRWLWRKDPSSEWYQCADPLEGGANWGGGSLEFDDIHATDWRIVETAEAKDAKEDRPTERPTVKEATYVAAQVFFQTHSSRFAEIRRIFEEGLIVMQVHWPTIFREEATDADA